jgi:hypothetical protein
MPIAAILTVAALVARGAAVSERAGDSVRSVI